jgi:hypothetical protein
VGLRGDFERARAILAPLEAELAQRSPEAQVRYALELGRTYVPGASARDRRRASSASAHGRSTCRRSRLRGRRSSTSSRSTRLHMMVMVDDDPADQLAWNYKAIAYLEQSTQPDARKWEGSLRNNIGHANRCSATTTRRSRSSACRSRHTSATGAR